MSFAVFAFLSENKIRNLCIFVISCCWCTCARLCHRFSQVWVEWENLSDCKVCRNLPWYLQRYRQKKSQKTAFCFIKWSNFGQGVQVLLHSVNVSCRRSATHNYSFFIGFAWWIVDSCQMLWLPNWFSLTSWNSAMALLTDTKLNFKTEVRSADVKEDACVGDGSIHWHMPKIGDVLFLFLQPFLLKHRRWRFIIYHQTWENNHGEKIPMYGKTTFRYLPTK